ncbi:hypothetical protein KFK09_014649 [Dendrobium nobile]|uniref:Uncharacterized protein n=1 Tax=Dendrobium nobile TaxID=94219 RepID=A0A8T3B3R7_DENNO|nr:hypothetical protein KFK09_024550 [Dendrobium nobile]KAI0503711.1 hypothetical protein KFK09_014649 [Dendrobium nobile]
MIHLLKFNLNSSTHYETQEHNNFLALTSKLMGPFVFKLISKLLEYLSLARTQNQLIEHVFYMRIKP